MDKWMVIHEYRRNSADGLVPAILCPDDETECVPTLGENGDPVLRCIECDSKFYIGTAVYDQMKKNLKELNV